MENYALARFQRRVKLLIALIVVLASVILVRYGVLALEGPDTTTIVSEKTLDRGKIYDRNGRLLAFDVPKFNLAVRKNEVDPFRISDDLAFIARALSMRTQVLEDKIRNSNQNFVYLAKRLDIDTIQPIQEKLEQGQTFRLYT